MDSLVDKVALITGASRGLGAGLAKEFIRQGMRVVACARTTPTVAGSSDKVINRSVDVKDGVAMVGLADEVNKLLGPIDLWINNAGVLGPIGMMRNVDSNDFSEHLAVNVLGVLHGSQAYVKHLRRAKKQDGILINISSGAARHPYQGWAAYCAGKAAVDRFTDVVALEENEIGLRAYALAPGIIDTDMQRQIRETPSSQFPSVDKFLDLKKTNGFSSVEFVARKILQLCFDKEHHPNEVCISLPLEKER